MRFFTFRARSAHRRVLTCWLSVCVSHAFPCPSFAESLPPYRTLLERAASTAPQLIETDSRVDIARGNARQAGAFPNPTMSYESENFAGNNNFNHISPVQNTVSISQSLELGGKRTARLAAGTAQLNAAQAESLTRRSIFAHDLLMAYAQAEAAEERIALFQEELDRTRDEERVAQELVRAGRESDLRRLQASAGVASAVADLEGGRADLAQALLAVSNLVGIDETYTDARPTLLDSVEKLYIPAGDPPREAPAILTAQSGQELAERQLDLQRRSRYSDITVSLGTRRLPGYDADALVANVSVPIPIFDRRRGVIAAELGEVRAANARLRAAELDIHRRWYGAIAQARAADARLKAAADSETAATEAYRLARLGYEAGRTPWVEVLNTRRALNSGRLLRLEARIDRVEAEAMLAEVAGRIPFGDRP